MSQSTAALRAALVALEEKRRKLQQRADTLKHKLDDREEVARIKEENKEAKKQEALRKKVEKQIAKRKEAEEARARKKAHNQAAATQRGTAFVIIFFLVLMNP